MIKFNIGFHLLNFRNTLTFPNGETKIYEFKSHGGRIFLLWVIGAFVFSYYNNLDFSLWKNVLIGSGFAIVWDIFTAILYHLKIKLIIMKNS